MLHIKLVINLQRLIKMYKLNKHYGNAYIIIYESFKQFHLLDQ